MTAPYAPPQQAGGTSLTMSGEQTPQVPDPHQDNLLRPLRDASDGMEQQLRDAALSALYGDAFPLIGVTTPQQQEDMLEGDQWVGWAKSLWARHRSGVMPRLHLAERNVRFAGGDQWIVSRDGGPWREPPKPRDAARIVHNMVRPALDMRIQINCEQRPGFRTRPQNMDPKRQKQAESQQIALEYQYDQQDMQDVQRDTSYWNTMQGVSFWHVFWNPERGQWDPTHGPLGDPETEVLRLEQVRVSANATATRKPMYWVIRKAMTLAEAISIYGSKVAEQGGSAEDSSQDSHSRRLGLNATDADQLYRDQETVDEFTIYCERSEYLPRGLTLKVVGQYACYLGPLLWDVVPMVRVGDGSSDPSFFPVAQMEQWVDDNMRVNALLSKWVEAIRKNADGRFLGRPGKVSNETLVGGMLSIIEVEGNGRIGDELVPLQGFSVGADVKELLQFTVNAFEQKSGWNDAARGSIASSASGRAILAIREQLERIYAPGVNEMSRGMTEWASINLRAMQWGYDLPRAIAMTGEGRSDLARVLSSQDFDGIADVEIDPETMMPLPRALRLFMLDQMLQNGSITAEEYRKRQPFAFVRNLDTPDTDDQARAKRIADAIVHGQPVPAMRWQDNEAIHQDVLEKEILKTDDKDDAVVAAANERWMALANQAQQKMGAIAPPPAPAPVGHGRPLMLPARSQPMVNVNPGIAAASAATQAAADGGAAQLHDQIAPH